MEANLVFDCPRCGWRMFGDLTHGYGEIQCKGCELVVLFVVTAKRARLTAASEARWPVPGLEGVDELDPVYVDFTLRSLFLPVPSPKTAPPAKGARDGGAARRIRASALARV